MSGALQVEQPQAQLRKVYDQSKKILLYVGFFSLIINFLMLVGPMYMLQVYDRVLSSGSLETLIYLTIAAFGLILVGAMLEGVRSRILVRMAGLIDGQFNAEMFRRMHSSALKGGSGGSQALRDFDVVRNFVTGPGLFFFFDAPWTPLFLAFVYLLHPMLFVVALIGAILLFGLALASEMITRSLLVKSTVQNGSAMAFADQALRNADTIEAMGMLPGLQQRWLAKYEDGLELQATASDRAGVLTAMSKFIRPVLQVAILGVGAYLVLQQQVLPGAMIAASIMMGRALAPIEGAIGNWRSFVLARGALKRTLALLQEPERRSSELNMAKPTGCVSVENLVAAAPGSQDPIIKGISFAIEAGDVLGVVGPSAAGKSSLARLLVGAWTPSHGHVRLDGVDVSGWNHTELGPQLGYLPQDVDLFEGTISENIARFGEIDSAAIIDAAQCAGVHELILRLRDGYDTFIGAGGVVLSGGQRQRIGLARAIYGNPAFVVMDEPNSNLDKEGEDALKVAIQHLRQLGSTVVVIAHRSALLSIVDKVLVLNDGKIQSYGASDNNLKAIAAKARCNDENPLLKQIGLVRSNMRSA